MMIPFAHYTTLSLQVSASKAMHVLIEVHHLEAVELVRHGLYLFLLSRLSDFDARRIPADVRSRCRSVLTERRHKQLARANILRTAELITLQH